jgi:NADH dehydrogenase (ubiquinone) 1 alpha subcomplex subunit 9
MAQRQQLASQLGTGLRNSVSGYTATVFGARGFLGSHVVSQLGKGGTSMILPHHGCEMEMRHLKVGADLGRVAVMPFNARDADSVRKAIRGSDIVINLIGKHYETGHIMPGSKNWTYEQVHVGAAGRIAQIAAEEGVERLVHVSSIAADVDSPSEWARTKGEGEAIVKEFFPSATVLRPATLYGNEDRFLAWYAEMIKMMPAVPMLEFGEGLFQPVYVGDVAKAIGRIVQDHSTTGQTYELAGQDVYSQKEIIEYIYETTRRTPALGLPMGIPQPEFALDLLASAINYFLPNPQANPDMIKLMGVDQVASGNYPGLEAFNISPTRMEAKGEDVLYRFRQMGHYAKFDGYHGNNTFNDNHLKDTPSSFQKRDWTTSK